MRKTKTSGSRLKSSIHLKRSSCFTLPSSCLKAKPSEPDVRRHVTRREGNAPLAPNHMLRNSSNLTLLLKIRTLFFCPLSFFHRCNSFSKTFMQKIVSRISPGCRNARTSHFPHICLFANAVAYVPAPPSGNAILINSLFRCTCSGVSSGPVTCQGAAQAK